MNDMGYGAAWASAEASDCLNASLVKVAPETPSTCALCAASASFVRSGIAWSLMKTEFACVYGCWRNCTSASLPPETTACTWTVP